MKLLINNEEVECKLLSRGPEKVVFLLEDEEFSFTLKDLSNENISILSKNEKLNLPIQEINQENLLTNAFGMNLKIEKVLPLRKKQLKTFARATTNFTKTTTIDSKMVAAISSIILKR